MKRILFLLPFFLLTGAYAQSSFPSYETVCIRFCEAYEGPPGRTLALAKMADGWHVQELDSEGEYQKVINDQLFWKRDANAWQVLKYGANPGRTEGCEELMGRYLPHYDLIPYFGYNGWYNDVIAEFGDKADVSDTLLYALSNAYLGKVAAMLGNQFGFANKSEALIKHFPPDALTEGQVKEYKKWADKELAISRRLNERNPALFVSEGNMENRLANIYLHHWLMLYLYQNEAAATSFLKPGLYDAFVLDMAHNFLVSCPPNAILFTGGDNDTYPLLYLQKQQGLRTDVTVLNRSLMGWAPYVTVLSQYGLVKKSISDEKIKSGTYLYTILANGDPVYGHELNQKLGKEEQPTTVYGWLSSNRIRMKAKPEEMELVFKNNYLSLNELLMLDIVAQNINKRPICFAITAAPPDNMELYFYAQGSVFVLEPKQHANMGDLFYSPSWNEEKNKTLLLSEFKLGPYTKKPAYVGNEITIVANYRIVYGMRALDLAQRADTSTALALLEKIDTVFPLPRLGCGMEAYSITHAYLLLGKYAKAMEYLVAMEKTLEENPNEDYRVYLKTMRRELEKKR